MSTTTDPYWQAIEDQEVTLRALKPQTAVHVVAILRESDPQTPGTYSGQAFYSGRNGDYSLAGVLIEAGWVIEPLEGDYHWIATHPDTGSRLRYCEGDVDDES